MVVKGNASLKLNKGVKIGILPFSNLSTYPNAGVIVAEAITSLLYGLNIKIIESSRTSSVLPEFRFVSLNDLYKLNYIGRKLGVDFLLFGYVEEYGYRVITYGERSAPAISFSVYLYDVHTREIDYYGVFQNSSQQIATYSSDPLITLLKDTTGCFIKDFRQKLF